MGKNGGAATTTTLESRHALLATQLDEYAARIVLDETTSRQYPEIVAHLSECAECRAELAEQLALLELAYTPAELPASAGGRRWRVPPRPQPTPAGWSFDRLGRLVVQFSESLLAGLGQSPLALARGGPLYRYEIVALVAPPMQLQIEIVADATDSSLAWVEVSLDMSTRGPLEQAGAQIQLKGGEQTWLAKTDQTGHASFRAIPVALLSGLRVEITAPEHQSMT